MDKDLTYDEWTQKVKIGILTEAGNCPVTSLIIMLQGKWKFQIIYEMCIKSRFVNQQDLYPSETQCFQGL